MNNPGVSFNISDFATVKEKIIKTNELILLYKEKSDKLGKTAQAFKNLKTKYEASVNELNRIKMDNERLSFTLETVKPKYEKNEEELMNLRTDYSKLDERYQQILIQSQLNVAKLEERTRSCKCIQETFISQCKRPISDDKIKELKSTCKEMKELESKLRSENEILGSKNKELETIIAQNSKYATNLKVQNINLQKELILLQNKVHKQTNLLQMNNKTKYEMEIESLKIQISELTDSNRKNESLEIECNKLREKINKRTIYERKKVDISTQTEDTLGNIYLNVEERRDFGIQVELNEHLVIEEDCLNSNTFLNNIFNEMILPKALSPFSIVPEDDSLLLLNENVDGKQRNCEKSIPNIIITPPTPILEKSCYSEQFFVNKISHITQGTTKNLEEDHKNQHTIRNPVVIEKINVTDNPKFEKGEIQPVKEHVVNGNSVMSQKILSPTVEDEIVKLSKDVGFNSSIEDTIVLNNLLIDQNVIENNCSEFGEENQNNKNVTHEQKCLPESNEIIVKYDKQNCAHSDNEVLLKQPKLKFIRQNKQYPFLRKKPYSKMFWIPYDGRALIKVKKRQIKAIKNKKPKQGDTILQALRLLQKNNIDFTISNKPLSFSNQTKDTENILSNLQYETIINTKYEKVECWHQNCTKGNNYMMLRQVPSEEPELLGFFSDMNRPNKIENKTNVVEKAKPSNTENLIEQLLQGIKELIQDKHKHTVDQKRKSRNKVNSLNFYSETETELENLFRSSADILGRNRRLLEAAKQKKFRESIYESESDMLDSGVVTGTPKIDTDNLSSCSVNDGEDTWSTNKTPFDALCNINRNKNDTLSANNLENGCFVKNSSNSTDKANMSNAQVDYLNNLKCPALLSPIASSNGSPQKLQDLKTVWKTPELYKELIGPSGSNQNCFGLAMIDSEENSNILPTCPIQANSVIGNNCVEISCAKTSNFVTKFTKDKQVNLIKSSEKNLKHKGEKSPLDLSIRKSPLIFSFDSTPIPSEDTVHFGKKLELSDNENLCGKNEYISAHSDFKNSSEKTKIKCWLKNNLSNDHENSSKGIITGDCISRTKSNSAQLISQVSTCYVKEDKLNHNKIFVCNKQRNLDGSISQKKIEGDNSKEFLLPPENECNDENFQNIEEFKEEKDVPDLNNEGKQTEFGNRRKRKRKIKDSFENEKIVKKSDALETDGCINKQYISESSKEPGRVIQSQLSLTQDLIQETSSSITINSKSMKTGGTFGEERYIDHKITNNEISSNKLISCKNIDSFCELTNLNRSDEESIKKVLKEVSRSKSRKIISKEFISDTESECDASSEMKPTILDVQNGLEHTEEESSFDAMQCRLKEEPNKLSEKDLFGDSFSNSDEEQHTNNEVQKNDQKCLKRKNVSKGLQNLKKKMLKQVRGLGYIYSRNTDRYSKNNYVESYEKNNGTLKHLEKGGKNINIVQNIIISKEQTSDTLFKQAPYVPDFIGDVSGDGLNFLEKNQSTVMPICKKKNIKLESSNNTPVDILSQVMHDMIKTAPKIKQPLSINSPVTLNFPNTLNSVPDEESWNLESNKEEKNINSIDEFADCPKSPDVLETANEVPKLIPTEKPTKLPPSKVRTIINKLMVYSSEETMLDDIIKEFAFQDAEFMVEIILDKLLLDFDDKADNLMPPSPIMTSTQRILLGFLSKLDKSTHPGIFDKFLTFTEKEVFNRQKCNLLIIEPVTRLYTGICKLRKDINRMRRFVCECFYFLGDFAIPMFFIVLTMWAEVLPIHSESTEDLVAKVIVQLCYLKGCNEPGYNLLPLRDLLHKYFQYPTERWNCEDIFKEILIEYMRNPSKRLSDYTLLIFLKNKPTKWVYQKIKNTIFPLFEQVPESNANLKATLVILLANICSGFNKYDDYDWTVILEMDKWFENLDINNFHPFIKRSVHYAKCVIPKRPKVKKKKNSNNMEKQSNNCTETFSDLDKLDFPKQNCSSKSNPVDNNGLDSEELSDISTNIRNEICSRKCEEKVT